MKKILFTLLVSCCSVAYSQTISFSDGKFKALLLSSNASNDIAKDLSGNSIAIDANGDGEIQLLEAQQVKILTIQLPTFDSSLVPDAISDATQFTNVEELYIYHANAAVLSYINNNKIKKVKYRHTGEGTPNSIAYTFNNCSSVLDLNEVITSPIGSAGPMIPAETLTIKNCPQIAGNVNVSGILAHLTIENCPITNLEINTGSDFQKLSVPNMSSLLSIKLVSGVNFNSGYQGAEIIANNCANLQEITTLGDVYNNSMVYISSINVNGCSNLQKIKGLNYANIDFSTAGLINLEELDCAFYNYYGYTGSYLGTVTLGQVNTVNLAGLPKLEKFLGYNQPLSTVNFIACPSLQEIDIVNSVCFMTNLNVNNLNNLHTLNAYRGATGDTSIPVNLQQITAQNCTSLVNLRISGNYDLKNLNLYNCSNLQSLKLGTGLLGNNMYDSYPELISLNLEQCTSLEELGLSNTKITSLYMDDCIALESLTIKDHQFLPQVNTPYNIALSSVFLENMPLLTQVNTLNNTNLNSFYLSNGSLVTALDFSSSPSLNSFALLNIPNLLTVNVRNNSIEQLYEFSNYNSNLSVCVDNAQLADMQNNYPNINFTANCDITLGTQNANNHKTEVQIFPNPVKDFVQVKSQENIKNIQLMDMQGRIIINQNYNQKQVNLDLSAYQNGVYALKIKTETTEMQKKIIKN